MTLPVSIYTAITQSQHSQLCKRQLQSSKTNTPIKLFKSALLNVLLKSLKTSQKLFPNHKP